MGDYVIIEIFSFIIFLSLIFVFILYCLGFFYIAIDYFKQKDPPMRESFELLSKNTLDVPFIPGEYFTLRRESRRGQITKLLDGKVYYRLFERTIIGKNNYYDLLSLSEYHVSDNEFFNSIIPESESVKVRDEIRQLSEFNVKEIMKDLYVKE